LLDIDNLLDSVYVADSAAELHPGHEVFLIAAEGLDGGASDDYSRSLLEESCTYASQHELLSHPHVNAWRTAFRSFGANPTRTRHSFESLLRRVDNGGVPAINRLVDIYNAVSIRYALPVGGEDLAAIVGVPRLVRAIGDEIFDTVDHGKEVIEHPEPGEVIWRDDAGVTCRRWSYRQCIRTRLTESSSDVLFILERLDGLTDSEFSAASSELLQHLRDSSPGARLQSAVLSAASRT
jgi:DNA/RNA-binding domain of Phe-tRNA-synthetase-like protein